MEKGYVAQRESENKLSFLIALKCLKNLVRSISQGWISKNSIYFNMDVMR